MNRKSRNADEPSMLGKLRRKFIALNMTSIVVVLACAFSAICFATYQQDLMRVNSSMQSKIDRAISLSEGTLDTESDLKSLLDGSDIETGSSGTSASTDKSDDSTPRIGIDDRGESERYTPVVVYRLADGTLAKAYENTTVSISNSTLTAAAAALADADDGYGTLGKLSLHYLKQTSADDSIYVAFTDTSEISNWQSLAGALLLVSVILAVVFFIINMFFSRWALRPVDQAWTQQKRFVADASHDLKTPLTVILANNSILSEHPESSVESQMQWIESTGKEAKQMQELVNDLLLLARLDEGIDAGDFQKVDFTTLLEGEMLSFESVAFENGLTFESDIAMEATVSGNPSRLTRLITTLLDNACKYTPSGGTITAKLSDAGNHRIAFSVNNSGQPIDPVNLEHVFERFYRADESRTNEENTASSHGLGLAIARAIAEEHGGTLHVESDERNGTTFTAVLPLK